MAVLDQLSKKTKENPKTIVYPEGNNLFILKAISYLNEKQQAMPILIGNPEHIQQTAKENQLNLTDIKIIDPNTDVLLDNFVKIYCSEREMPERVGKRIISQPLYFGAMMVRLCLADCMVAGIDHATEEVIMASELIIGLKPGINVVSSFFLMHIPDFDGGENGQVIFADPAVNPAPTPEQLADIALTTAKSAQTLLGWVPRVAMLSFSTKGSAEHPIVDNVIRATKIVNEKNPQLNVEGELQADTALVPEVAEKKLKNIKSNVAGKANILIFPDLNAANISCKLVQRMAKAQSYGPILQGFKFPVSDLSRGASVEDIVGASIIAAASV